VRGGPPGSPLPIANGLSPPTRVCEVRHVVADASGTAQCDGGAQISVPLRSAVHLTGDLLSASDPPNVPGIQPCLICSTVCVGGAMPGCRARRIRTARAARAAPRHSAWAVRTTGTRVRQKPLVSLSWAMPFRRATTVHPIRLTTSLGDVVRPAGVESGGWQQGRKAWRLAAPAPAIK
jgi:hypothetical protein